MYSEAAWDYIYTMHFSATQEWHVEGQKAQRVVCAVANKLETPESFSHDNASVSSGTNKYLTNLLSMFQISKVIRKEKEKTVPFSVKREAKYYTRLPRL